MPEPMYRHIADQLRMRIESGELGPEDQLPTELDLREQYDASRNTIRDAIKLLITRGLVETRAGQGTFVAGKITPFITPLSPRSADLETAFGGEGAFSPETEAIPEARAASGTKALLRGHKASKPQVQAQQPPKWITAELDLTDGESVVSRHQQRYIDGRPWSLQTSFYPRSLARRGAEDLMEPDDIKPGAVTYIANTLGIRLTGWRDKLKIRPPDNNETTFFKLPDDGRVAVIETVRIGFDQTGKPFVLAVTIYPADRNEFVIDVGEVPTEITNTADSSGPGTITPDSREAAEQTDN
jgi:GntR family transcriptional regulator